MVLSTTKRTSSISSITRQSTGAGPMKAGLPYIVGRSANASLLMTNSNQTVAFWSMPLISTVVRNRPINMSHGMIPMR
jgi:hypothetical protein